MLKSEEQWKCLIGPHYDILKGRTIEFIRVLSKFIFMEQVGLFENTAGANIPVTDMSSRKISSWRLLVFDFFLSLWEYLRMWPNDFDNVCLCHRLLSTPSLFFIIDPRGEEERRKKDIFKTKLDSFYCEDWLNFS